MIKLSCEAERNLTYRFHRCLSNIAVFVFYTLKDIFYVDSGQFPEIPEFFQGNRTNLDVRIKNRFMDYTNVLFFVGINCCNCAYKMKDFSTTQNPLEFFIQSPSELLNRKEKKF